MNSGFSWFALAGKKHSVCASVCLCLGLFMPLCACDNTSIMTGVTAMTRQDLANDVMVAVVAII